MGFKGSVASFSLDLDEAYLSGISLTNTGTLGDPTNPLIHIWSFALGETHGLRVLTLHSQVAVPVTMACLLRHLWERTISVREVILGSWVILALCTLETFSGMG